MSHICYFNFFGTVIAYSADVPLSNKQLSHWRDGKAYFYAIYEFF